MFLWQPLWYKLHTNPHQLVQYHNTGLEDFYRCKHLPMKYGLYKTHGLNSTHLGCIHLLNTCKYCDNTRQYCGNTHEYWPNTWKMCSPASAKFTSIVTILVSYEAILMDFKACGRSLLWNWLVKLILAENLFKIASKLTSIVTILANIALAGDHIFQVLGQYSWVLPQYLQVLSQYLRVLSRWIGPKF